MQVPGSLDSPSKHGKGTQTLQGLGRECATASGIPKDITQLLHGNVEAIKGTAESTCVLKASAWGCVVANGELARMVPTLVYVSCGGTGFRGCVGRAQNFQLGKYPWEP